VVHTHDLPPGTYTYWCRIHAVHAGAFASSPTDTCGAPFKFLFRRARHIVVAAVAFTAWYVLTDNAPAKPKLSVSQPVGSGGPATPVGAWRVRAGSDVYVGYRIKELFGDAVLKRDAVGRTGVVTGTMTITQNKLTTATVTADVTKLDSGRARARTRTRATTARNRHVQTRASP